MSKERISIIFDVDAEISKAKGNIGSLTKIFDGIGGNKGNQLRNILSDINAEYQKLADESGKSMSKIGDFSKAEKSTEKLSQLFRKLEKEMGNISKISDSDLDDLFPPDVAEKIKKASDALKTFNTMMDNSTKSKGAIGKATKEYEDQEKAVKKAAQALKELQDVQNGTSKKQVVTADVKVTKADDLKKAKAALDVYQKELEEANRKMEEFKATKAEMFANHNEGKSSAFRKLKQEVDAAEKSFKSAAREVDELNRELKNMVVVGDLDNDIQAAEKALEDAQEAAKKLKKNLDEVSADEFSKALGEAKKKLEELTDVDLSEIGNVDDLNKLFKRFTDEGVEGLKKGLEEAGIKIKNLGQVNEETGKKVEQLTDETKRQNQALGELDGVKSRITEFFKLDNAIQLVRQGIRQTFETIKELDKAMAETAVVTDFSVGDMWDALPQYTKAANELGTTTLGAYETMTLFYQQGLDTNEAFAIGTETMKMARIAGLDYAEATDLMTAALRGFNMELNETSAQRINDVYSELAAITAADTEEIATAMTKTASIAKSANMEFETTAAFLSQIIETTREPAETAGTAMKTIIARFTEMKKAASDIINVDGEEINVNKVEEALKSAGVALRDLNGEFRDTDDVFLELASKWDSLDVMTQRYIATMAAGSRQQSRFIAMMQDYDRTIELVEAAYNSSGSSAAQFAKTQETLESKLNKLKNAWNEFLMGIADSKIVKGFVDVLTGLLNVINKLTGNSGLAKLTVALSALLGGKIISNKIFGNVESSITTQLLAPLKKAGPLVDNVIGKLLTLNKSSIWSSIKNGWTGFINGASGALAGVQAILPIIAILVAEMAVLAALWYFSDEQVETRKLKEAQKLSEGLAQGLEHAREAVEAIGNDRSGLETLKNDLKDLTAGTEEWKLKLLEVQAEESRLISKYGLSKIAGATRIDSNGSEVITSSGWQTLEDNQTKAQERLLVASQIADASMQRQEFSLHKVQSLEEAEDTSAGTTDEKVTKTSGAILGTIGAIGGFMKAGSILGTGIWPGVGTAIGTIAGGIAGVAAGFGLGELTEEIKHDEAYSDIEKQLSKEERIADQKKRLSYKNTIKSSMQGSNYSDEEVEAISSIAASNMDNYIKAQEKEINKGSNKANEKEMKEWAKYNNYSWVNGKAYDVEGKEVDISDKKAIAKQLAVFRAIEQAEKATETAGKSLQTGGKAVEKLGENIKSSDFAKVLSGDASASYDLVEKMLQGDTASTVAQKILSGKTSDESKEKLIASLTGYTEKEIEKGLKKNDGDYEKYLSSILQDKAKETAENQKYMQRDFFEEALLSGYGRDNVSRQAVMGNQVNDIFYDVDTAEFDSLTKMVEELDAATLQTVTTIGTNLRTAFQSSGVAGKIFFEALSGMDSSQIEKITSYLGDVDFSNPIKGAHAFQTALANVGDDTQLKGLIENLQEVSKTQYDVGSQFDYLMNSGIYDGLQEDIAGIIEENGKLTADNIIELSGASEELGLMLEQDENMAESLAKAFTIVETQGLDAMQGITTATLKALGETQTLATMYDDMMTSIENFEPAVDTMSGIDFIGQSLEKMKEMIDSGEYGNAQLHSYLEHFFGEGSADSIDKITENYNKLTRWSKNEGRNFWTEASEAGALIGDSTETETISTTFKTGNLSSIQIAKGLTTAQALEQLQNSMHITEDAARDYLAVLTSHSLELANALKENDAGAAVKTLVETRQKQLGITEGGVISEDEVKTIAVAYDMDEETLTDWLEKDYGITIVGKFVDENNNPLTGEALYDRLNQELGNNELSSVMVLDTAPAESGFESVVDYVETKEVLMDLGMTEEQANETIDNFIEENNGKVGIAVNGEVIPETTAQAANDWANSMLSSITTKTLTTLVNKLADVDFTPVANALKTAFTKPKYEINIKGMVSTILDRAGTWLFGLMTGGTKPSVDVHNKTVDSDGNTKKTTTTTKVISPTFNVNPTRSYSGFAKGSDGLPKDEEALTGEEGVELVQNKDGTAYLVGTNGPEITSLEKGDVVYPHDETKKILKGSSKKTFHGYAGGSGGFGGGSFKKENGPIPVIVDDKFAGNIQKVIEENTKKYGKPEDQNKKNTVNNNNNNNQSTTANTKTTTNNTKTTATNNTKTTTNTTKKTTTVTNNKSNAETLANLEEQINALERKRAKGEINALEYQTRRNNLLTQKHGLLETSLNSKIAQSKGSVYYDKKLDFVKYNSKVFNSLNDKDKEAANKIYEETKKICEDMNKIEDEVGSIEKVTNDTTNEDQKLEALERRRKNGDISADEYERQKQGLLTSKYGKLSSEFYYQLENNPEKEFFSYDEKTDTLKLDEEKFSQIENSKEQEEVKNQFETVNGILKEMNTIEDDIGEINKKFTNDTTNEKSTQEALDRKYEKNRMSSKEYGEQTRNNLLSQQSKLQAQFSESLMKSAESAFFKYDKALDTLLIDEEKLSQLSEERAKEVLQEYETLKGINDELNGIEDQIEGLKGDRFDTNTEDVTQRGYELLYQNGDITPEVYQEKMKQSYDSENRSLKGDMNDILSDLPEQDIGAVYYDAETGEVKENPLFDVSKLDKKELKAYKQAMKKIFDEDNGWNKEIKDIQNMTDKNKQAKAWEEFKEKYEQSEYTGYYTMNEFGQLLDDKINHGRASSTVQDSITEKVNDYAEKWEGIKSNKEAKEQLTPNKKEKDLDTTNHETQLKNLENALNNEEITFIKYIEKRDAILKDQMARLYKQADDLYKRNDQFNEYFDLQRDTQTGLITGVGEVNDNFYELSEQQQEDVRNFMQQLSDIIEGIYGIKNTMDDPEYDNPEDRAIANGVEAGLWNNSLETNALERDRQELAQYQTLIGKLPSEVQGPLNLGMIGMNMYYEGQEIQINRREQQYYEEQKALNERNAEYLGSREEVADPNSDKYYYYDSRYGYMFDEAKARRQNDDEVFAKIKEEVEGLQSTFDKLQAVAQELSGGIIQKSVRTAGKSLTDLSKAFKNNERTSDNVTDAFNSLEQTLGLSDTALDKFEGTLTNIINSSGLSKKEFKGLGILDEKQTSKMKDFLTNSLGENAGNLISMIFGGGTTNGLDFTGAAMGAFGEFMNFSGSFLNFDMIGLGMDAISQSIGIGQQMYNMGKQAIDKVKQGIEKAKQMIEQVIQYIAQATQVLVDAWTNREDYLYNFLKVIEKHLQEYERLQRYSTQLEKGRLSSSQDILDNWNDQWKSLQEQLEEQTERLEQRQRELNLSRINPFALISGWDPSSDTLYENREVKFLWDIIIGLGEAFAPLGTGQFFSQLNQLYEDYDKRVQQSYEDRLEAEQALLDIEDERLELVKVGADEATEFEQKLLDSLIQKEQQTIDELSRLNEAVTEANQKLLSTLQDNLDKIRQDRENERTEEELGEKERRLAYLRQDTSGANQMEIKKLEKELDREHEDYTDTLIDQKISELEKQNELAAEQRQQQIDLLQSQLDYAEKYGLYWDAVYGMLYTIDENGKAVLNPENFDLDGNIRENSELAQLLGTFSDRMSMSTWSSVLDNEEAKRLGRYYGAFIGMNGVEGNWKNRWALEDPGANDPNYTYPMEEIPDGLRGILSRIEIEIKKYFVNSDMGLVNTFGRIGNFFKRGIGKLIGNEEWANEKFTGYDPAHTQADAMNAIHKTEVAVFNGIKEGFNNFFGLNRKAEATGAKTTSSAKSNNTNNYGTQNYGSVTENFNFNIGTIGENINLDEMVDRVSSAIRQMFTPNVNYATKSR